MAHSFSMVGCVSMVSSRLLQGGWFVRVEVLRTANVGVVQRWLGWGGRFDGQAVQVAFQNRFHALVGTGLESDCAVRRRLQARRGVLLAAPQNAETGPVALFRVGLLAMIFSNRSAVAGRSCGPIHQSGRRPFQIPLMCLGAVFDNGGGAMARVTAGHGWPRERHGENLHRRSGGAHFYFLLDQLVGHAVPVVLKGDMVIDVDAVGFPSRRTDSAPPAGAVAPVDRAVQRGCAGIRRACERDAR